MSRVVHVNFGQFFVIGWSKDYCFPYEEVAYRHIANSPIAIRFSPDRQHRKKTHFHRYDRSVWRYVCIYGHSTQYQKLPEPQFRRSYQLPDEAQQDVVDR